MSIAYRLLGVYEKLGGDPTKLPKGIKYRLLADEIEHPTSESSYRRRVRLIASTLLAPLSAFALPAVAAEVIKAENPDVLTYKENSQELEQILKAVGYKGKASEGAYIFNSIDNPENFKKLLERFWNEENKYDRIAITGLENILPTYRGMQASIPRLKLVAGFSNGGYAQHTLTMHPEHFLNAVRDAYGKPTSLELTILLEQRFPGILNPRWNDTGLVKEQIEREKEKKLADLKKHVEGTSPKIVNFYLNGQNSSCVISMGADGKPIMEKNGKPKKVCDDLEKLSVETAEKLLQVADWELDSEKRGNLQLAAYNLIIKAPIVHIAKDNGSTPYARILDGIQNITAIRVSDPKLDSMIAAALKETLIAKKAEKAEREGSIDGLHISGSGGFVYDRGLRGTSRALIAYVMGNHAVGAQFENVGNQIGALAFYRYHVPGVGVIGVISGIEGKGSHTQLVNGLEYQAKVLGRKFVTNFLVKNGISRDVPLDDVFLESSFTHFENVKERDGLFRKQFETLKSLRRETFEEAAALALESNTSIVLFDFKGGTLEAKLFGNMNIFDNSKPTLPSGHTIPLGIGPSYRTPFEISVGPLRLYPFEISLLAGYDPTSADGVNPILKFDIPFRVGGAGSSKDSGESMKYLLVMPIERINPKHFEIKTKERITADERTLLRTVEDITPLPAPKAEEKAAPAPAPVPPPAPPPEEGGPPPG